VFVQKKAAKIKNWDNLFLYCDKIKEWHMLEFDLEELDFF
jgi:hypothetical protein